MSTNREVGLAVLVMIITALVVESGLVTYAGVRLAIYHATGLVLPW